VVQLLSSRQIPDIIFATVALGRERSSSPGGPEWPSRSDIAERYVKMRK